MHFIFMNTPEIIRPIFFHSTRPRPTLRIKGRESSVLLRGRFLPSPRGFPEDCGFGYPSSSPSDVP